MWPKTIYFGNLHRNREFHRFWPKSKCFEWNRDFSKILTELEIFTNFDQNRYFLKNLTKIEIFKDFDQNRNFSKFWPKSGFLESFTSIEIFGKCDHNRDFSNILNKMGIFRKFCPESIFSIILIKIEIFWKSSTKSGFSKILFKITIFLKFWPKSSYFENLTWSKFFLNINQIEISGIGNKIEMVRIKSRYFEALDQTWKFHKSLFFEKFSKIAIFENLNQNRGISQIFTNIEIFTDFDPSRCFLKFGQNRDNFYFDQDFSNILTKIKIFETLDQNRDVSNKIEVFRKLCPNLKFSRIFIEIDLFRRFCPKSIFWKFWPKSTFSKIVIKI